MTKSSAPRRESGIPPLPPTYWNHQVDGKIEVNLWGSGSCGQHLDVKELRGWWAGRVGFCQPSRPRPWSRSQSPVDKVRCHNRFVDLDGEN